MNHAMMTVYFFNDHVFKKCSLFLLFVKHLNTFVGIYASKERDKNILFSTMKKILAELMITF